MQRLRIQYAKRGRLRFTSHRDFSRAFERAVARARIPMAYSSGFNPHPRISYAGAAPTGAASEAEYLEIGLAERVEPDAVRAALDQVLPPGLDVVRVVESPGGALTNRLTASHWQIDRAGDPGLLRAGVEAFLAQPTCIVERMTKKGLRSFDCRAAVVRLEVIDGVGGPVLDLVLQHGEPAVRPDDVLRGLRLVADLPEAGAPLLRRMAQGPLVEGAIGDPLA